MLMEFEEGGGVFEIALLARDAGSLDFAELGESFLELAGDSPGVKAERGDRAK